MTEENTTNEGEMTEQQKEELSQLLGYGSQLPEGKHNVHSFLQSVVKADDTLRISNLNPVELGNIEQPVRALQSLSLFAKEIMNKNQLAEFFEKESEIVSRSALSKEGFLIKMSVTSKQELADVTPKERKENPSWFKKKAKPAEDLSQTQS